RDAAAQASVHAATDITGFGLAGHAFEVARASGVALRFDVGVMPLLPRVEELVRAGHLTRGETSNRAYVGEALRFEGVPEALQSVLVDPQTSGGLLLAMPLEEASQVAAAAGGVVVGRVESGPVAVTFAT
ncbi:MAG: AIR synthase-related protein, partial [Myxococcota bacterium]